MKNMWGERNQNTSKNPPAAALLIYMRDTRSDAFSARARNHLLWEVNNVSSSPPPPRARAPVLHYIYEDMYLRAV